MTRKQEEPYKQQQMDRVSKHGRTMVATTTSITPSGDPRISHRWAYSCAVVVTAEYIWVSYSWIYMGKLQPKNRPTKPWVFCRRIGAVSGTTWIWRDVSALNGSNWERKTSPKGFCTTRRSSLSYLTKVYVGNNKKKTADDTFQLSW